MDYRHIFKAGGYVISKLVEDYYNLINNKEWKKTEDKKEKIKDLFKICRIKKDDSFSYFLCAPIEDKSSPQQKDKIFHYFLDREKIINPDGQIMVKQKNKDKNNEEGTITQSKKKYDICFKEERKDIKYYALFSSRYMLQDIACMYKTLLYLNNIFEYKNENENENEKIKRIITNKTYNGLFSAFLEEHSNCICEYNDQKNKNNVSIIKEDSEGLAEALFELTYQCIPQITSGDIKDNNIFESISEKLQKKEEKDKKDKNYTLEKNRHSLKRMWCIIRDFLVHPVFSECFKIIIDETNFVILNGKTEYAKIELPGDVWNNNSKFALCFWGDNNATKSSGFVRQMYDNRKDTDKWNGCLPIHFDITFNFVPRMCEEDKCDICPLAKDSKDDDISKKYGNKWKESICPTKDKYCTLALCATGIKHKCDGTCKIFNENQEEA